MFRRIYSRYVLCNAHVKCDTGGHMQQRRCTMLQCVHRTWTEFIPLKIWFRRFTRSQVANVRA